MVDFGLKGWKGFFQTRYKKKRGEERRKRTFQEMGKSHKM